MIGTPTTLVVADATPAHGILDLVASPTHMVGRESELEALIAALDDVRAGHPQVVLVGGEAGVGKTRLVEELARQAPDAAVLVGACVDLGDDALPFAPFAAALREPMRAAGVADLVGLAAGESDDRRRLYEAVADLLEHLAAERPVVLVVEDLHWADRSTRELLAFLAGALRDAAVLTVATFRTDELHRRHPLRPFVSELSRTVQRIHLDRLDRRGTATLVEEIWGRRPSEPEAGSLFERSDGNPFLIQELAACPPDCGLPQSLREVMLIRVDRLSASAQAVLRIASVIGQEVTHPLLAAVCARNDIDDGALHSALREAVDASILVLRDDHSYAFRHSLLRESLHFDLLPGEHARIHAAVAQQLTDNPSLADPQQWALEVAHHWYAAHDLPRALPATYAAADAAARIHAYAEQLRMLERVLELWPVVPDAGVTLQTDEYSVVVDAAHAATRADDHDRVLALTDRAVVLAGREGDPQRIAESLARRGRRRLHIDMADSVSDIRRALEVLPETPSASRAQALDALAVTLMLRGDTSEATAVAEAASLTEVSALITLGTLLVDRGEADEGLAVTRDALTRAQADDEQLMAARALTNLSHQLCGIGRHREAETVARQGLDVVRLLGLTRTYSPILSSNVVDALIHLGELDEAEAVLQPALTAGGLNAGGLACLGYLAATIAYQRGDLDAADSLLDRTEAGHGDSPLLPQDVLPIAQVRAATALERGDIDRALEIALGELSGSRVGGHTRFYWPLIVVAAEAATAQAERGAREDTLKSLLDTVEAAADAEPSAGASGVAWSSHVAAALASARGSATAATWIDVASAYNKLEEPFPQGRALLSGAEQAASDGDRATARTLVREADQLATQIGTGLLRSRTNRLARKLGVDLGHDTEPAAGASYGLTDREREVLHRVAEGRTNRQIADDLFISPKTASVHVSNILAKLGVASRGEAAAFAHRHGLN